MLLKYNYLVSGMSIDYQGGIELWGIRRALRLATSVLNKRCISCQERTQLEEIPLYTTITGNSKMRSTPTRSEAQIGPPTPNK